MKSIRVPFANISDINFFTIHVHATNIAWVTGEVGLLPTLVGIPETV